MSDFNVQTTQEIIIDLRERFRDKNFNNRDEINQILQALHNNFSQNPDDFRTIIVQVYPYAKSETAMELLIASYCDSIQGFSNMSFDEIFNVRDTMETSIFNSFNENNIEMGGNEISDMNNYFVKKITENRDEN